MTAADMSSAETSAESTAVLYAKPVMVPVGAKTAVAAKTVMIKASLMIEAFTPVPPQGTPVVVPVARVAIGSVIAWVVHASNQAHRRDKYYCKQDLF